MPMENLTPGIRNAVRAVIVCNDQLLLLKKTGGNKAKAAKLLGVGRATLYRFLNEYPEAASEDL